jgi:hypothetical protein
MSELQSVRERLARVARDLGGAPVRSPVVVDAKSPTAYRHEVERDAFGRIVSVTSFPITPEQADAAAAKLKESPFYRGAQ